MKAIGFCGPSGVGKTTLVEALIAELKRRGQRVSVIKHAHKRFDLDQPGKDTWRHRQAGATEVLVASDQRLALMREYDIIGHPAVEDLLAELSPCDWALVEGFKHASMHKVEVWRTDLGQAPVYPADPFVVAVATDRPDALPVPTGLPVLAMSDVPAVADFLMSNARRFEI
jgi:molybdopterin-guanine dinucleotide biosynthesis adapter protein